MAKPGSSTISIQQPPKVVVLAGPNGAGKSTSARSILQGPLDVDEFVNADVIAQGLSAFDPSGAAIAAGRVMLSRLKELARARASFAFETTLASKTFTPWLAKLIENGYELHLIFLWLPSADVAIQRVADRVKRGGHSVPEPTIRRRHQAGLHNFFRLYQPLASKWRVVDNSGIIPKVIAASEETGGEVVFDSGTWEQIVHGAKHDRPT